MRPLSRRRATFLLVNGQAHGFLIVTKLPMMAARADHGLAQMATATL
jgi:hypothetical protein